MGGGSSEREVSLESGRCATEALRADDGRGPAEVVPVEWGADGCFDFGDGREPLPAALTRLGEFDAVFLALHGGAGEDGTLQGALDLAGVRYTGSGVGASAIAMDKPRAKALAQSVGAQVAADAVLRRADFERAPGAALDRIAPLAARGAFLKPRAGGSSVAVIAAAPGDDLGAALAAVFENADEVLVESAVSGLEVTCAVLDRGRGPKALPVLEILPRDGRFFDFEQKYATSGGALERCPAELIDAEAQALIARQSLAIHEGLGCRGLTRCDYVVEAPRDGADCRPRFLELNTLPGLTPRSLAPQAAQVAGIDYRSLCLALVEDALRRSTDG